MFTEILAFVQLVTLLLVPTLICLRELFSFLSRSCDAAIAAIDPSRSLRRHSLSAPARPQLEPTLTNPLPISHSVLTQTTPPSTKELWLQYQQALK
jgi:hypothetical protein